MGASPTGFEDGRADRVFDVAATRPEALLLRPEHDAAPLRADVPPAFHLIGDAQIGQRTLLSYMIEGAMRTGTEAMREAQ